MPRDLEDTLFIDLEENQSIIMIKGLRQRKMIFGEDRNVGLPHKLNTLGRTSEVLVLSQDVFCGGTKDRFVQSVRECAVHQDHTDAHSRTCVTTVNTPKQTRWGVH